MKILLIHNHYQQPGGEDAVFWAEAALLRSRGHEVQVLLREVDVTDVKGAFTRALKTLAAWIFI